MKCQNSLSFYVPHTHFTYTKKMKCKVDELDVKGVCIPKRSIRVFDAGDVVVDRFTVVIGSDAFGMSTNPLHPEGFNQFAGNVGTDVIIEDNPAIGNQISFDKLPSEVKEAINQRLETYDEKELEDIGMEERARTKKPLGFELRKRL